MLKFKTIIIKLQCHHSDVCSTSNAKENMYNRGEIYPMLSHSRFTSAYGNHASTTISQLLELPSVG